MRLSRLRSRSRSTVSGRFLSVAVSAAVLAAALSGCQQLFTTSLATALARSSIPVPTNLTPSQAAALAAQAAANQDTTLAAALVSSLETEIAATTDPATKQALQASAAGSAVVASGVGAAVTSLLSSLSSNSGSLGTISQATVTNLMASVTAGATPGVVAALSYLDPSSGIPGTPPSSLTATDYAIAAIVVASSALPPDPTTMTPAQVTTFQATPAAQSAQRILNQGATLVAPGSASASLLNNMESQFQL
jgi:hypothetical protein